MLCLFSISAQQTPLLSHWFFNKVHQNPAFAGLKGDICANVINRQQWIGFDGAPQTTAFTINTPVNIFGIKSGVGINLMDDRLGYFSDFSGSVNYAYFQDIGSGTLSIGTKLGLYNKAIDGEFEGVQSGDEAFPQNKDQGMVFDMGFGLVYSLEDLYVGLSATHLLQPKLKLSQTEMPYLKRHYYLTAGYKLDLASSPIELYPNLLTKFDGASAQITINLTALYNKKFWGGVTYRTRDALGINIGAELFNGIKLGYSYDIGFSKLISTNSGTHEVMLGYCFSIDFTKEPQKYRSVRFL